MSHQISNEARTLANALIRHSFKTSPEEAIEQLTLLYLYKPDSQKQNHNPLAQNHNLRHLLDPETGEIHKLQRIHLGHHR